MDDNSLLEELHYHRVFMRTNRQPSVLGIEPIVTIAELVTFISDALDYALFVRGVEGWVSPFDSGEIQRNGAVKRHFTFDIGDAIVHECAIEKSLRIAEENKFEAKNFLDLPLEEAMEYAKVFIKLILIKTRPVNTSFINALAFSSTLCGIAAKNYKQYLMHYVAISAAFEFQSYFPYEWIYYDFKHWASVYVLRHKQIHDE